MESSPSDEERETPRDGLGNFAKDNTGKKNPSDLGNAVCCSLP